jgi:hypothetical protein
VVLRARRPARRWGQRRRPDPEEAVADLRQALEGWFAEFGLPDELTMTIDVA